MVERRQALGFALEARHALRVAGEEIGQHLQRNLALQLGVERAIHLTHAAGADGRKDLVGSEFGSSGQHHFLSTGTRRRSSSKKFSRNTTSCSCLGAAADSTGLTTATRLPSG